MSKDDPREEIAQAHNSILQLTNFYGNSLNVFQQRILVLEQQVKVLSEENRDLMKQISAMKCDYIEKEAAK